MPGWKGDAQEAVWGCAMLFGVLFLCFVFIVLLVFLYGSNIMYQNVMNEVSTDSIYACELCYSCKFF